MTAGPACPRCGTPVQPHWDWCEGCGYDPDGLRPPVRPPEPPGTARGDPTGDHPHRPSLPRPTLVGGLAVVALALGAGAWAVVGRDGDPTDADLAAVVDEVAGDAGPGGATPVGAAELGGTWTSFEGPGGSFTVALPGPVVERGETLLGSGSGPATVWAAGPGPDHEVSVAVVDLPPGAGEGDPRAWLAAEGARLVGGEELEAGELTVDGAPALSFSPPDPAIGIRRTVVALPGRAVTITTTWPDGPDAVHARVLGSFDART